MASLHPSQLDSCIETLLAWGRRRLMEAVKAKNEAKALQQHKKIRHLKELQSMRRAFMEQQGAQRDECTLRTFLREQLECLRRLKEELEEERRLARETDAVTTAPEADREKASADANAEEASTSTSSSSGLESFRSMSEEISKIERGEDGDVDCIVEGMRELITLN